MVFFRAIAVPIGAKDELRAPIAGREQTELKVEQGIENAFGS
jgi:hypothetical protein